MAVVAAGSVSNLGFQGPDDLASHRGQELQLQTQPQWTLFLPNSPKYAPQGQQLTTTNNHCATHQPAIFASIITASSGWN